MAERASFAAAPTVEGRTIRGLVLPWSIRASDRNVTFAPGSVTWEAGEPVLRGMHDGAAELPLAKEGAGLTLTSTDEGIVMEAVLPDTTRANDVLELIHTGVIDSLSAEVAYRARTGSLVTAATLVALALVPVGAFDDAKLFARQAADRRRRLRIAAALA